jgi:hypothetical protein
VKYVKLTTIVHWLPATIGHIFTEPTTPYSFLHEEYSVTSATYNLYSVYPFEFQVYFYLSILITIEVVNMPNIAPLHEGIESSGGTVIQALTFSICLWRVVNFTARRLYPWYPFSRRLDGSQSWSRDFKEENILFP